MRCLQPDQGQSHVESLSQWSSNMRSLSSSLRGQGRGDGRTHMPHMSGAFALSEIAGGQNAGDSRLQRPV